MAYLELKINRRRAGSSSPIKVAAAMDKPPRKRSGRWLNWRLAVIDLIVLAVLVPPLLFK